MLCTILVTRIVRKSFFSNNSEQANVCIMLSPSINNSTFSVADYRRFRTIVRRYYRNHGRRDLPWRLTTDPYAILVSEIMLQQTQVDRVIPKYVTFMKRFPTVGDLSRASLGEVLQHWQGLGYNRRAKYLHQLAVAVMERYGGTFPADEYSLRSLPGVGVYTARAVLAFAYDIGLPFIETNIRTVYIHHFFTNVSIVSDAELMVPITATTPTTNARHWYYALMDYGSYLKKTVGNTASQSSHYKKQPVFVGSDRQIRGAIIRLFSLDTSKSYTITQLVEELSGNRERIVTQLQKLVAEKLVTKNRQRYQLPI